MSDNIFDSLSGDDFAINFRYLRAPLFISNDKFPLVNAIRCPHSLTATSFHQLLSVAAISYCHALPSVTAISSHQLLPSLFISYKHHLPLVVLPSVYHIAICHLPTVPISYCHRFLSVTAINPISYHWLYCLHLRSVTAISCDQLLSSFAIRYCHHFLSVTAITSY